MKKSKSLLRLNANENFYGCSPKVFHAIKKHVKSISFYPNAPTNLENKIAEEYGVVSDNIIVGAGSVRLIDGIIQSLVSNNEEILIFENSFIAYQQLANAHHKKIKLIQQPEPSCDIKHIFPLINSKTKIIFIANPNNPTGTIISHNQIHSLLKKIPKSVFVVLDEAYCEYVSDKSFPNSLALQKKYNNLIILRTFSKIYGLAGLRVGYAIANTSVSNILNKSRIPFFLNTFAEAAAAAALDDKNFVADSAKKNSTERMYLFEQLNKMKYRVVSSHANFIYITFNSDLVKTEIYNALLENGILACNLIVFGQSKCLRITVGNRKATTRLLKIFKSFASKDEPVGK